jgi:hypothetical protein
VSDDDTSIGPPPRRPAPRQVAPPKVRTGVTVPPGGGLRPVSEGEDLAIGSIMPAVVVPPPMPRSRQAGTDPRFGQPLVSPTHASARAPDTFGGQMTTPTSMDAPQSGARGIDHGAAAGPDPRDTGDAPHVGSEVGTHGGFVPKRRVPAAVLFAIPALVVGLGGSGLLLALQPAASAGSPSPAVASAPAVAIEPALLLVAQVNEVDPARVLPFAERHDRLDRLAPLPEAAHVDRRLNLAFDLVQAADAPDPCGTFAAALDALAAAPDPSLFGALSTAHAPSGDAPACAGLEARRQALLATLSGKPAEPEPPPVAEAAEVSDPPPPEPEPAADPRPTDPAPAGDPSPSETELQPLPRKPSKPAKKPAPATTTPKDPPPVGRVDEELRPFGQ